MEIRINTGFRTLPGWKDSQMRTEHVLDRMQLRGVGIRQIKEGIQKGAKKRRDDGTIECEFRWYKIVYREFQLQNIRKIYPITVMV